VYILYIYTVILRHVSTQMRDCGLMDLMQEKKNLQIFIAKMTHSHSNI
jgi:hypothetical protein